MIDRTCLRESRIAALAAICLVAIFGLATAEDAGQPPEKPEPVLKYDPEFPDSMVVATVNSEPITVGDVIAPYERDVERDFCSLEVFGKQRGEIRRIWVKHFLLAALDTKLRVLALTADLDEQQWKTLDKGLDKGWNEYTTELCKQQGVSTMSELADKMKEEGADLAAVQHHWREARMADQFALTKIHSAYEPGSQELHDYFEEHMADWESPSRVKWQQIVVRRHKGEESNEAEGRARKVLMQLRGGADFADLAHEHSEGATKARGGRWDWTECDALACHEVGEFLSTGRIGTTSDVIRDRDQFQIVKILRREEASRKRFAEVEAEIRDTLKKANRERLARDAVVEFAENAVIKTVFDHGVQALNTAIFDPPPTISTEQLLMTHWRERGIVPPLWRKSNDQEGR